jgi:hypothetical protein
MAVRLDYTTKVLERGTVLRSLLSGQSYEAARTRSKETNEGKAGGSNPSERAKTGCRAPGDCAWSKISSGCTIQYCTARQFDLLLLAAMFFKTGNANRDKSMRTVTKS